MNLSDWSRSSRAIVGQAVQGVIRCAIGDRLKINVVEAVEQSPLLVGRGVAEEESLAPRVAAMRRSRVVSKVTPIVQLTSVIPGRAMFIRVGWKVSGSIR